MSCRYQTPTHIWHRDTSNPKVSVVNSIELIPEFWTCFNHDISIHPMHTKYIFGSVQWLKLYTYYWLYVIESKLFIYVKQLECNFLRCYYTWQQKCIIFNAQTLDTKKDYALTKILQSGVWYTKFPVNKNSAVLFDT